MKLILLLPLLWLAGCSSPAPSVKKPHAIIRTVSPEAILNGTAPEDSVAESAVSESTPSEPSTAQQNSLSEYAQNLLGVRYRYGGNSPEQGFDCSGFVSYVYRNNLGIVLPRSSTEISHRGTAINRDELRVGDLVFFNTLRRKFSHVGIYLGHQTFIHSPSRGGSVRIDDMSSDYWRSNYNGARRISD